MGLRELEASPLVVAAGHLWQGAIEADFLCAIRDDNLPEEAFRRWLVQDYHFVLGLAKCVAVAAGKTPRPAQKTLIAGLAALDSELDWFETNACQRGWPLDTEVHPICRRYVDFLVAAAYQNSFETNLAIIFAVEAVYFAAWSGLDARGPYAEFIERWSNEAFAVYVGELKRRCEAHPHPAQQRWFNEVLRHELDFWQMTWEG